MNAPLTVAVVQQRWTGDRASMIQSSFDRVTDAADRGARLIVLQELHTGPYFCQHEDVANFALAEPIPGPSTAAFSALAKTLGVVLVTSLFERRAPGLHHNTAVVFDSDGSIAGMYRKMHIPDDPGFTEKFYFTPGDLGFTPIATSVGKLGVLVCWDQWYPEAARLMAMAGAELLIYPTAIGWNPTDPADEKARQRDAWITIQRAHAVANGCYVAAVNRIGTERPEGGDGIEFWGQSFVAGTSGEIIAKAGTDREEVMLVPVDLGQVDTTRTHWPFLRDRRIDAYGDLTRRYLDQG
jgi:N-carbamoylputrescine amidase